MGGFNFAQYLKGKRVSVIGFGRSGKACVELLIRMGAKVFVSEILAGTPSTPTNTLLRKENGIEFEFGAHTNRIYDSGLIIISPGIPVNHPIVIEAKSRNIPVMGELEFASRFITNRIIGITGTNGKTTTVFLIQKLLESAKIDAVMCGNVGIPLSQVVGKIGADTVLVVEASTFQLETIEVFRPFIGVLLNITADHLDRHKDFEEYKAIKLRMFANQTDNDFAVLNFDDPNIKYQISNIKSQKLYFSTREPAEVWIKGKQIYWHTERLCGMDELNLEWECLVPNYLASIVVGKIFNLKSDSIINGLKGFKGVAHRLESVGVINGIKFINNSMCTNPAAFVHTLYSFRTPVVLIAGGKRKNVDINPIVSVINDKAKYAIFIGETSEELSRLVKVQHRIAGSMEEAVALAYEQADEGDTVLLSPGFASFDWFTDFRDRGEKFKQAVKSLRLK